MVAYGIDKRLNLLICGHDLKFIRPFIEHCQAADHYRVRLLETPGHQIHSERDARDALRWADVIFCEWALRNAVWFSHHKQDHQLLIVRLHSQEIRARDRLSCLWEIDWGRVDRLILISQHLYDWIRAELPILRQKAALIYNPIDALGSLNRDKPDSAVFRLGMVGMVPALKRLDLAINLLGVLRRHDPRYQLHVKGHLPQAYPWMRGRTAEMDWYRGVEKLIATRGLSNDVIFDPPGNDMPDWYQQIGHILSISDFEGSHQAVAEGMAAGCVPAIRNWIGADRIYPPKYVTSTLGGLAELILNHSDPDVFGRESSDVRDFARSRFEQGLICARLDSLILQGWHNLERGRDLNPVRRRVLPTFLILAYINPGNRGGYRIRVEQEIKALMQTGCRVHLACLFSPDILAKQDTELDPDERLTRHRLELADLGCDLHLIAVSNFFRIDVSPGDFKTQIKAIRQLIESCRIDVLHCEALYCARLGRFVKDQLPRLILSIDWHGIAPEEDRLNGASEQRITSLERWEQQLLRANDLNVFVSEAMAQHYAAKYAPLESPQLVIPCCVSDDRFIHDQGPLTRAQIGLPEDKLIIVYAGSMARWQCGEEMIRLFARLYHEDQGHFLLLLVPSDHHPDVWRWANGYSLPEKAYLLTEARHEDVPAYLRLADVGLLLRRDDPVNRVASPTKLAEYLAVGLPVLLTEGIGDYSAMVKAKAFGLMLPSSVLDTDGSDPSLLKYLQSLGHGQSSSRDCITFAHEQLHWEPSINRWLRVYAHIADQALGALGKL